MSFTVSDIIEVVNKRTENRASNKLDLKREFYLGLAEFVNNQHFWWRRKNSFLTTTINAAEYDLNDETNANAPDIDEIEHVDVYDTAGNMVTKDMGPILDPAAQVASQLGIVKGLASGPISGFYLKPGALNTLCLTVPADSARILGIAYWATPQPPKDADSSEVIPLVPNSLQWGLEVVLRRRVFDFLFGQKDSRYTTANLDYQNFLEVASKKQSWSSQSQTFFSAGQGSAIRAR